MTNQIYISDVTGSRGCHNDDDKARALDAAWEILKAVDAAEAMAQHILKIDDEPHDAALAAIWEKAQQAANAAFTEGWLSPGNVMVSLEAR